MGEKLDRRPTQAEKYRIAVHEVGHALLSELAEIGSVAAVHVASRSNALGYVRQTQQDDIYLYTADYLLGKIGLALAGAIAEEVCLGNRSTGASNDIQQAAKMAKQIVFGGMSKLGIVSPEDLPQSDLHKAMVDIFNEREKFVYDVINRYRSFIETVANKLVEIEYFDGSEFRELLRLEDKCA
jgi:vesicle-fusing ATPase